MPAITIGNQLYLYKLLSREVGTGHQVTLARIEETLLADDIWPSDLDCKNVRELLEQLDAFVRLTVFKKGRAYATILVNDEWEAVLERAENDSAPRTAEKTGAKSWKKKRSNKDPKPAKPRPKGRPEVADDVEPELIPEPETASEPLPEPEAAPEPAPEPEATSEPTPEPEATSEPEETDAVGSEPGAAVDSEQSSELELTPGPKPVLSPSIEEPPCTQTKYPSSFSAEVLVRDRELSTLYQMLPLDVDPFVLLDEDWRVAQSTESFTQEKGVVTFPLRYRKGPEGEAVRVSFRRTAANHAGKRWVIESIDQVSEVGFDGLPTTNTDVMRELAQFALLGSWESLANQLTQKADGGPTPLPPTEMRDYLCITFHRIQCERKLVVYDQGRQCAFDTGLLNSHVEPVLMRFHAIEGDVVWQFVDFCTPDEAQLTENPPLPATYLSDFRHIEVFAETPIRLSNKLIRSHEPELSSAIDLTLKRIRRDCRLATPTYDPMTNEVLLVAPIVLPNNNLEALVLSHDDDGFVASAIIPLERAATHARIVSRELPRWLEGFLNRGRV